LTPEASGAFKAAVDVIYAADTAMRWQQATTTILSAHNFDMNGRMVNLLARPEVTDVTGTSLFS
jgi:hypothetical protein